MWQAQERRFYDWPTGYTGSIRLVLADQLAAMSGKRCATLSNVFTRQRVLGSVLNLGQLTRKRTSQTSGLAGPRGYWFTDLQTSIKEMSNMIIQSVDRALVTPTSSASHRHWAGGNCRLNGGSLVAVTLTSDRSSSILDCPVLVNLR